MNRNMKMIALAGICAMIASPPASASTGSPRNVKLGEAVPAYRLPTMMKTIVDSAQTDDQVVVLIYIVARQRSSERAAKDANRIVNEFEGQPVELIFVTANTDHQPYFEQFWKNESIDAPLAFDTERKLYSDLGLVVFPTTIIIDREGRLAHVISTRGANYPNILDGYIRHTLGLLNDAGLKERIEARTLPANSPKSLASRHRTVARLLREKGLLPAAEKELLEALKLDPDNIDARLDLADLCLRVDRVDDASRFVDQALEINSRHRRAKLLRGITFFRQNKLDEAEAILTEALVLNPDPARTHFYLGRINEARGDKDKAIEHYRQALRRLLDEPIGRSQPSPDISGSETEGDRVTNTPS